ncbi:MAG TPA: hypothetical protein VL462_00870 [Candidatus Nitrosotalea sp.]|jgi:hypothetical protein|nr:hypothetical protein [Candidatus Nitrosotalea sp.]
MSFKTGEISKASEPTAQTPAVRPQVVDQGSVAGGVDGEAGSDTAMAAVVAAVAWLDMAITPNEIR